MLGGPFYILPTKMWKTVLSRDGTVLSNAPYEKGFYRLLILINHGPYPWTPCPALLFHQADDPESYLLFFSSILLPTKLWVLRTRRIAWICRRKLAYLFEAYGPWDPVRKSLMAFFVGSATVSIGPADRVIIKSLTRNDMFQTTDACPRRLSFSCTP